MNRQVDSTPKSYHDFMRELTLLVSKWDGILSPEDFLIIAAQWTGNIAAMVAEKDGWSVMATIVENIKLGNKAALIKLDNIRNVG